MRIWVVNPFDPIPGDTVRPGRYARICELLAERGHEVTWWSSNFFHMLKQRRSPDREERRPRHNFRILLLPTPPYRKNVSLRRVYSHIVFARQFVRAGLHEAMPDLILTSFPPIESSFQAVRRWGARGTRVVIDVQDLWPESFEFLFPRWLRPPARVCMAPLRQAAEKVFWGADAIIAVSEAWLSYGLHHAGRALPSLVLPLGVDLQAFDNSGGGPPPLQSPRERSATFAGTIGRGYDLWTVLKAARVEQSRGDAITFRIAGEGPDLPRLRLAGERMGLRNVVFHGLLPFGEMTRLLRSSMVGLNVISQETLAPLGNKLFDYLAAGLPVLNSSPGEAAELLEKEEIGLTYPAGDAAALSEGLMALLGDQERWEQMSARARRLAVDRYDRQKIYRRIGPFLEGVCAR